MDCDSTRFRATRSILFPGASVEGRGSLCQSRRRGASHRWANLTGMDRYEILTRAVGIIERRKEELGQTITREEGQGHLRRPIGG